MPDIFVSEAKNTENTISKSAKTVETKTASVNSDLPNDNSMVHLFTSYCENPGDISFENQDEDENVLLFIRKDLITNLPWILSGIVLAILPLILMPILNLIHFQNINIAQNYLVIIVSLYYLFVASFIYISFITWYFNINIITEKRVVDIDFEGIVFKNVATTKLTLVQDVSYTQVGVMRTLFDYGNVLVQTAGTIDNFTFEAVPRPEDAVHVVENLIGKRNEQF